jgi:hypothetical protein
MKRRFIPTLTLQWSEKNKRANWKKKVFIGILTKRFNKLLNYCRNGSFWSQQSIPQLKFDEALYKTHFRQKWDNSPFLLCHPNLSESSRRPSAVIIKNFKFLGFVFVCVGGGAPSQLFRMKLRIEESLTQTSDVSRSGRLLRVQTSSLKTMIENI